MADKLPLGFINDDDKLRRNDSWRREEKHKGEQKTSTGVSLCIRECCKASAGVWGWGGEKECVDWLTNKHSELKEFQEVEES